MNELAGTSATTHAGLTSRVKAPAGLYDFKYTLSAAARMANRGARLPVARDAAMTQLPVWVSKANDRPEACGDYAAALSAPQLLKAWMRTAAQMLVLQNDAFE